MADEIGVMFEGRIQQWDTPTASTTGRSIASWPICRQGAPVLPACA
jgi:hypothetical protein